MATYTVYLTVHFCTEVEADSLEAAEAIGSSMSHEDMESYDESDFYVEPLDSDED